jgi:hypothetical protein
MVIIIAKGISHSIKIRKREMISTVSEWDEQRRERKRETFAQTFTLYKLYHENGAAFS